MGNSLCSPVGLGPGLVSVAAEACVRSLTRCSGFKDPVLPQLQCGSQISLDLPRPLSRAAGAATKIKKKKRGKKEKRGGGGGGEMGPNLRIASGKEFPVSYQNTQLFRTKHTKRLLDVQQTA